MKRIIQTFKTKYCEFYNSDFKVLGVERLSGFFCRWWN